jgi:hypothetical protein
MIEETVAPKLAQDGAYATTYSYYITIYHLGTIQENEPLPAV